MAFQFIANQNVRMQEFPEKVFTCAEKEFCALFKKTDDTIDLQIKQTPCGDNLVVEGEFTDSGYYSVWGYDPAQWIVTVDAAGGYITHISGSGADTLNQDILPFQGAGYYVIYYTVSGMTAGQMTVSLGTDVSRIVSENGIYVDYVDSTASDELLVFDVSNLFDGAISSVYCYKLLNESELSGACSLVDIDGNFVMSPSLTDVRDDRISFQFSTSGLTDGCYRVQLIDSCFDYFSIVGNTQLMIDTGFDDNTKWTTSVGSAGGTAVVSGSKFTFTPPGAGAGSRLGIAKQAFDSPPANGNYLIQIEVETGAFQSGAYTGTNIQIVFGEFVGGPYNTLATQYNPSANTTYTFNVLSSISDVYQDATYVYINTPNDTTAGHANEIKRISIKYIEVLTAATGYGYLSNCLNVQTDTGDALLVQGQVAEDVDSIEQYSNGFLFTNVFNRLHQRLFLSFTNPRYPKKNESYLYSNSYKKKTFNQKGKQYDLIIHELDESGHDCLSTIFDMEYTYIGESNTVKERYICEENEYSPDWSKGESSTAEASIEISRINATVFK